MNKSSLKRVYEARGLEDYKLKTIDDLFYIYGIKLSYVEGYSNLEEMDRFVFNNFVINYFNCNELEGRNISILKVNKVGSSIRANFMKNDNLIFAVVNVSIKH
ncbi:hypothetical protein NNC19_17180 [Clostridium sp. SHJSY1]|uniref:hypothetical protein n=1 Tax=Clostridium sp. SHJSY1 TaxID=2942483 RepID=UPI002874EA05|nr:hypothetical protein [Clostridium sp. SHJSY1]MDS0527425.1 hypothetical protein [Clostridium sp. SHJSY1]